MKHKLIYKGFINPNWLNKVKHGVHQGVVNEQGEVELDGETLTFCQSDHGLQPGVELRIWLADSFWCESLADYQYRQIDVEKQKADDEAVRRKMLDQYRDEANAFNEALNVPVEWRTGYKSVLSGLSVNSWGDGTNRATVGHIELLAPLTEGRLQRNSGDFLCTRDTGKQWTGDSHFQTTDSKGQPFDLKVTCKQCIKMASRWACSDSAKKRCKADTFAKPLVRECLITNDDFGNYYEPVAILEAVLVEAANQQVIKVFMEEDDEGRPHIIVPGGTRKKPASVIFRQVSDPVVLHEGHSLELSAVIVSKFFSADYPSATLPADSSCLMDLNYEGPRDATVKFLGNRFVKQYEKAKQSRDYSATQQSKIIEQLQALPPQWQYHKLKVKSGRYVDVPKLPFVYWALRQRYPGDSLEHFDIPNWTPICSSNAKMYNDNPYHTDWWVGAGFNVDMGYPEDVYVRGYDGFLVQLHQAALTEVGKLQSKYLRFQSTSVGGNNSVSFVNVCHYEVFKNDVSKVPVDAILILPNLSVEFEPAILKANKNGKGGVVSQAGGPAAHLSVVGKEMDFPVFIDKNALKKFRWVQYMSLDGSKGTIQCHCL